MANSNEKIEFLVELSRSLHAYGIPAHRIELYTSKMGERLGLSEVQVLSLPTSIQISAKDDQTTMNRLIRTELGGIELNKLKEMDGICDDLVDQKINLSDGLQRIRKLHEKPAKYKKVFLISSFAVIALAVNLIVGTSSSSLLFAPVMGLLSGSIFYLFKAHAKAAAMAEVFCALIVTAITLLGQHYLGGLATSAIILGSIIILVPGLSITTSILELSTDNLVSGTARLMGSLTTLFKLFLGFYVGKSLAGFLGPNQGAVEILQLPLYIEFSALIFLALAFIYIFQMDLTDYFWVLSVAIIAFGVNKILNIYAEPNLAVFASALVVSVYCQAYARITNFPATNLMVPGIILLVPGSIGYKGLLMLGEQQTLQGIDLGFRMVFISMLIVGGLLLGQLILAPRRTI